MNTGKADGHFRRGGGVRRRFEHWRLKGRPAARIPDSLWAAAVRDGGRRAGFLGLLKCCG